MAKVKKFGTFSGVFTPSILTIMGVIMYLRFPAILGQAGLINTIGIIVIAHIISITTSLSVASLSTDKPVKTGGTYFMISRSLGLPIGGTLGLALFVGLSFSVSLYLIGFSESFLQYWGFEVTINTIRLAGSIVLLAVTTLTFISTSLAIKSQYFILATIALSLISIFFGNHDFKPEHVNLAPLATTAPFMVLFGIFFPAVTGFEAGVSMSGDLKEPSKSLPIGTMLAVGIGFVAYIGLALFYSFTVDANALANDPQILFKISLVPALVVAGIWGATLSSALGSILGAPRILQAIAMDKIAPKFFSKGSGKTNEPRNALLLAYVIAEVGILIGELDVIARIVSMFFITTYAFLNMASAIESWSSSDFRPAFKIPRFVSVLGALSAFIVMILLDFLALAGATVTLGWLYFYLKRKELFLESGDAWSSFWTNLAKRALLKLSINKVNKRNWRPNIILFSGGENARPHLVELGLALTGKLGALTDFNLSVGERNNSSNDSQTKIQIKDKNRGYFARKLDCTSVKEGIKAVTNIYGFSGFDPNTVLLGWSTNSQNIDFLTDIINDFKIKNLNAVFLDYDNNNGFGKKESIDIWWNGKGSHLSFSLNILRFLLSSPSWRDASIRIMIINSDTSLNDSLYRNTNAILLDKRIQAELKVINDDFGSRSTKEIIQTESAKTDLIIIGLSQNYTLHTHEYIEKINSICKLPASILLLCPSSEFEEINLIERTLSNSTIEVPSIESEIIKLPEIEIKLVKNKIENLDCDLMIIGKDFYNNAVKKASHQMQILISDLQEFSLHIFNALQKDLSDADKHEYQKVIDKNQISYLRNSLDIIQNENTKRIKETEVILKNGIADLITCLGNCVYEATDSIAIPYQIKKNNNEKVLSFPFRKSISYYIDKKVKYAVYQHILLFEENSKRVMTELRNTVFKLNDKLDKLEIENANLSAYKVNDFIHVLENFNLLKNQTLTTDYNFMKAILDGFREISIGLAEDLKTPENLKKTKKRIKEKTKKYDEYLNIYAEAWGVGMLLINNVFYLDILALSKKIVFKNVILKGNSRVLETVSTALFSKQNILIENLKTIINNIQAEIEPVLFPDQINLKTQISESYEKATVLMYDLPEELLLPEIIYKEGELIPFADYNQVKVVLSKSAFYNMEVLLHEPLYREMEKLENTVKETVTESKEANSMLLFHQNNIQNTLTDEYNIKTDINLFKKLLKQIEDEKAKVKTTLEVINHNTDTYISEAFSKLFYHSLMKADKNVQSFEHQQKSKKLILFYTKFSEKIKKQINNSLIFVLNNASSGKLLSKKYMEVNKDKRAQTKEVLDLVDELLPERKTYSTIPVFYRNLMSSNSKITDEFWVPREKEMKTIKEALNRHRKGFGGAVFITGVHGAGKTTFSHFAVKHLFKSQNTIWVNAPIVGSTNPIDLLNELKKNTSDFKDFTAFFNSLPNQSVIIIKDMELWWERRPDGGNAIKQLIELIKQYSQKVFFILNCNTFTYILIKQLYPIDEYSLATIPCSAFNSQELQQMIIQRHKSSGISLSYNGRPEESISQLTYSILFNRYFNLSKGIPGDAINIWKANMKIVNNDNIEINKPKKVSRNVLYDLSKEWLIILAIFIHHKNIDIDKLARLTGMPKDKSAGLLFAIANSGLILKKYEKVYTLGRNVEPLVTEVCKNKGLI